MLAGVRSFVLAHHFAGFFGNGAHLLRAVGRSHIEHRTYVQTTHGRMRVPGSACPVLLEHLGQAIGVFGQVLERHGTVLDERHRFTVSLHRHHDVESGFADIPDGVLESCVFDLDDAVGQAKIAQEFDQTAKPSLLIGLVVTRKLDQQNRIRFATHGAVDSFSKRRIFA